MVAGKASVLECVKIVVGVRPQYWNVLRLWWGMASVLECVKIVVGG